MRAAFGWMTVAVLVLAAACETGPGVGGGGGGPGPAPSHLASGLVGPDGGKVATKDGAVVVEIPAGALDADRKVTVDVAAKPAPGAVGTVIDLGPSGTVFARPVRVTLVFPADLVDVPRRLRVATATPDGWAVLADQRRDLASRRISGTTLHFSQFGLVEGGAREGCAEDLDCGDDEICDPRTDGCVERVACDSDWECRNAGELCSDGACRFACRDEEVCDDQVDDDCDGVADDGCPTCEDRGGTLCPAFGAMTCVDTTSDPAHCGGCEVACGERETCVDSSCQGDPAGGCTADSDCEPGEACVDGTCQSNSFFCRSDADCPPRMVCNDGFCR